MHCVVSLCCVAQAWKQAFFGLQIGYKKYKLAGNAMRYSITVLNENYIENAKVVKANKTVDHVICNQQVRGSSPCGGTI